MSSPLKDFLSNLPAGIVQDDGTLERLLSQEWHSLRGADLGGMQAYKLVGRAEQLVWQPPCLMFTIERHGATVNGSTRAELQDWKIDSSSWTAEIVSTRRRQLRPTAQRVYVGGLADKIADAIMSNRESASLKRYPDGRVKVLIGTIIPDDGYKQTIGGRRRRFRRSLESLLSARGWVTVATNTYKQQPAP